MIKDSSFVLKSPLFIQLVCESMPTFSLHSLLYQEAPLVNFREFGGFIFVCLLVCFLHAFPAFTDIYKILP